MMRYMNNIGSISYKYNLYITGGDLGI